MDATRDAVERTGAATGRLVTAPEVEYLPYGPAGASGEPVCTLVSTFGAVELEYAAIRRGAGLLDAPHRGTLRVTGADRIDFLNRMLTQELKHLEAGAAVESFWLNRKGRIDADLLLVELGDEMLIDLDIHQAAVTVETLRAFIFSETCAIDDVSGAWHRLSLHGSGAVAALARHVNPVPSIGRAIRATIGDTPVVVARRDQVGEPGFELFVERDRAGAAWDALVGHDAERSAASADLTSSAPRVRPIGWQAYNTARIEGGTPLFNIDFDTTTLPHETSLLDSRVSFRKGCYLGQEVVARMQSLGKPKQVLVGLRISGDHLPMSGSSVFDQPAAEGTVGDAVGVVTSSTISPMLSAAPIAFAMVRTAFAVPDRTLIVSGDGAFAEARVGGLRFWRGGGSAS